MTKYARDEFDKVPETASRQGVHRAASAPSGRACGRILAVGVVALAIGVVSFLFLPQLGFTQAGSQACHEPGAPAAPEAGTAPVGQPPKPSAVRRATSSAEPPPAPKPEPESATPSGTRTPTAAAGQVAGPLPSTTPPAQPAWRARVSSMVQADGWTWGRSATGAARPSRPP